MRELIVSDVSHELEDENYEYLVKMGVVSGTSIVHEHPAARLVDVAMSGGGAGVTLSWTKPHFSCVFVFHEGYVLLVRKNHPAWQNGRWNGVGGAQTESETAFDCAYREFREETGGSEPPELTEFCVLEDSEVVVHFFRGTAPDGQSFMTDSDNDVGETLQWHSVNHDDAAEWQDPSRSVDNLTWLIPMALDRFHLQGLVTALRRDDNGEPTP